MSSTVTKSVTKGASLRTQREEARQAEQKEDNIVFKSLRMAETLKKYPKPTK
ncbi:MAG: hypothetical protein J7619_30835 [Dyadobacter sp.]|uniref:hypothetical protein n=1 Tax=Dyadobacter sp. TaxID=1914288 RepID=UPI001B26FC0C|nr:hypothetical protein [Dyadobacter sp.]MBO9617123.1 hypothetical protein [Dyadobacter sp.]